MPEFIAAVMPMTRSLRSHSRTSASPKTAVYCGGAGVDDGRDGTGGAGMRCEIDFGLAACHFSMPSRPPSSAGAKPLPLTVAQWMTTGRSASKAVFSARRMACTSWPSITPRYAQSSSSHHRPGAQKALTDSLKRGPSRSNAAPMPTGSFVSFSSTPSRASHSPGSSRTRFMYRDSAPTLGEIDMPLSFKMTTIGVPRPPAWETASNATPPVIEPSPMTATTLPSSAPPRSMASLIPTA